MRRQMRITLTTPPAEVVAPLTALGLTPTPDGSFAGPFPGSSRELASITARVEPDLNGSVITLEATDMMQVPYFQWCFVPVIKRDLRRMLRYATETLRASEEGRVPPEPPVASTLLPTANFSDHQVHLLSTACVMGLYVAFGAALFGQNSDAVARTFDASNADLGTALAITRIGVLVALVATALADRLGRRRLLALSFVGVCIGNAVTAAAPNLPFFTGTQLVTRAFVNTALVVAGIAVVEDAPDGARAFAATMFALAAGAGFALAVALLPIADFGSDAWRISFALSGATLLFLPRFLRTLPETRRYTELATRAVARGRVSEVVDRTYGKRFVVLGAVAFLTGVFSAPSAQLTNRFLIDERGFSNSGVAGLRAVTNGLPGLFGILLGGRLAESKGRKPVAITALFVGSTMQIVFFLTSGVSMWAASAFAIIGAGAATLALGTLDAELFPTEVRGTSNALLLVFGVTGAVTGLFVAGRFADSLGGLGYAIALCGAGPLIAAAFLVRRLPEPAGRGLDDVSPTET